MRFHPLLQNTRFITSAPHMGKMPPDMHKEVAFIGRSNCGKSSALNAITHQKSLAKVSKTPGRTQLLNCFEVTPIARLIDLPGYGFAQVSADVRAKWDKVLSEYFYDRQSLVGIVLIMDARHPLTDLDQQMLDFLEGRPRPLHILLSKADKLKRGEQAKCLAHVKKAMSDWSMPSSVQLFSAKDLKGLESVQNQICSWLNISPKT